MELVRLRRVFAGLVALLLLVWLLSVEPGRLLEGFWAVRGLLVPLTGMLAVAMMGLAVLLASRPVQIESALGGLDKFYRLHKWLGVGGALMAVAHWAIEVVPRSMVRAGWIVRPARAGGGGAAEPDLLQRLRDPAAEFGEWAFYLLLVLVVISLWKRVPYHRFFQTHRLMAPVFLALVFHSVVLVPREWWLRPIGPLLGLVLAASSGAALVSLFGRIGHRRLATGRVDEVRLYPGNAVLDVTVRLTTAWPGHAAGQFAFLDFDDAEGAHPFTISSAWRDDGRLTFSIKGLGDYTRRLPEIVRAGQAVTVEGPYGRFDFQGDAPRQLWIGGGVGITPFVARLQALVDRPPEMPIDLIYSTAAPDDGFIAHVAGLAERAGVRLRVVDSTREGFVTPERVAEWVPEWRDADVWFCGPQAFAGSLRGYMTQHGLPPARFHQELFEMR